MSQWTINDIPSQQGRIALVTGANSGLGLETTRALSMKGAHVIMACRNLEKASAAQAALKATVPNASLELVQLDLASLASIREFADKIQQTHDRLDLLFNNAGVMAIPRKETSDGFEMQFGTNHLGHFALTGLLLPLLLATPQSRVVSTTSIARSMGKIDLADLNRKRAYGRWEAYGQSKLANLLFAFELQSRLSAIEAHTLSVAAHPGFSNTELQTTSATMTGSTLESALYKIFMPVIAQSASMGALPQLYAATAPAIRGGELIGPAGFFSMRGYPRLEPNYQREYNRSTAVRLWDASVQLTGVDYAPLH